MSRPQWRRRRADRLVRRTRDDERVFERGDGDASGGSGRPVGGPNLPVTAIGDPEKGAQFFESKGCSDCHSFNSKGAEDAPPPLDSMTGHLSAREIASMSGDIWIHVPRMIHRFEEGRIPIPFPSFSDEEMPA